MDQNRARVFTQLLSGVPSRREILRGLAAIGLGLGVTARLDRADAQRAARSREQAEPNAYGCLNVGRPCISSRRCCSGLCRGKKGAKRCQAHDTGDCRDGQSIGFCGGTNVGCAIGDGNPTGVCGTTTGKAAYCVGGGNCFACASDADCRRYCGRGAACVRCPSCTDTGGTMCASPGVLNCTFPTS